MADALCGPSNALQNFQKHSSVDRTLQQDRLVARQSPQQDFRTAQGQHVGAIDPEFEAFQAGHPPTQSEAFQRFPAQHAPPPNFAGPAALPDWASDFQRLHVSSPPPLQQQRFQPQAPQHSHTASWHQEFMRQRGHASSPAPLVSAGPSRPMYGGAPMMGFGAGQFAYQQPFMAPQDMGAQAKQKDPVFDDAAFASAFDAAAAEVLEAENAVEVEAPAMAQADQRRSLTRWEEDMGIMLPPEHDSILAFMKEHAFNEYCRHQLSEYLPRAGTRDPSIVPDHSLASLYMSALERLESNGRLQEHAPDPLLEHVLDEIVESQDLLYDEQFMFRARASRLRDQIRSKVPTYFDQEESQKAREREDPRLRTARVRMFQHSLQNQENVTAEDKQNLEASLYHQLVSEAGSESRFIPAEASRTLSGTDIRTTLRSELSSLNQRPEELLRNMSLPDMVVNEVPQPMQQQPAEQQQQHQLNHDDEELARTAGQLVESVSHDTSQKFMQSRFLALMRQLRDREVRVDGDKIVETTPSQIPATQQDLDLGRNGGEDSNRTMTGALQAEGKEVHDVGESHV